MEENLEIINELKLLTEKHLKIVEFNGYISIINETISKLNNLKPEKPKEPVFKKSFVDENKLYKRVEWIIKNSEEYEHIFNSDYHNKNNNIDKKTKKVLKIINACSIFLSILFFIILIIVTFTVYNPVTAIIVLGVFEGIFMSVSIILSLFILCGNGQIESRNSYNESDFLKSEDYNILFRNIYNEEYDKEEARLKNEDKESYDDNLKLYDKEMEKYNSQLSYLKEKEDEYLQELNIYKDHCKNAEKELQNVIKNCKYIPETYSSNGIASASLLSYFENKRADSLKEAINLYEMEKHLGKIVESLDSTNNLLSDGFKSTYIGLSVMADEISKSLYDFKSQISNDIDVSRRDSIETINAISFDINNKIESRHEDVMQKLEEIDYDVNRK